VFVFKKVINISCFFSFDKLSLLMIQESTVCTEFSILEKLFELLFWKNNYTVSNTDINIGDI
jgi:hypothetical protein